MKGDELLTTAEAAAHLGVSAARVRQYIMAGDLPARKVGRDLLVRRSDLQTFKRPAMGRPRSNRTREEDDR